MSIPNIPTDYLYKFVSVFGLLCIVFIPYFLFNEHREIKKEIAIVESEIYVLNVDDYFWQNGVHDDKEKCLNELHNLERTRVQLKAKNEYIEGKLEGLAFFDIFFGFIWLTLLNATIFGFWQWYKAEKKDNLEYYVK